MVTGASSGHTSDNYIYYILLKSHYHTLLIKGISLNYMATLHFWSLGQIYYYNDYYYYSILQLRFFLVIKHLLSFSYPYTVLLQISYLYICEWCISPVNMWAIRFIDNVNCIYFDLYWFAMVLICCFSSVAVTTKLIMTVSFAPVGSVWYELFSLNLWSSVLEYWRIFLE